jgi:hypothetical protein
LAMMSDEVELMLAAVTSTDVHKGKRLPGNVRAFIYLLTHCVLCMIEYGGATFDRSDPRPDAYNTAIVYRWANSFLMALTEQYVFPVYQSLHVVVETETEIVAEVALILLLLEPDDTLKPDGMAITPLYVYQIMNRHLMSESGEFTKEFLGKIAEESHYTIGHIYITFAFLRAECERAGLRKLKLIPQAPVRPHPWIERIFFDSMGVPKVGVVGPPLPAGVWRLIETYDDRESLS